MLTDFEYEILAFVRANRYCHRYEIINNFDPQKKCVGVNAVINHLADMGYIRFSNYQKNNGAELTPMGLHVLTSHQEIKNRRCRDFWIGSILIPICVSVAAAWLTYKLIG